MRLGLSLFGNLSIGQLNTLSTKAETAGFESVWIAEGSGSDAFAACTVIAENTSTIKIGTDIISIFTRHPCVLASSAATVDLVSKGRLRLGLGASHESIVHKQLGLTYSKPIERMKETIQIIKGAVSATGPISFHGEIFSISNYSLWFTPVQPEIKIYLAAGGPRMINLLACQADGSLLFLKTEPELVRLIKKIKEISNANGRVVDIGLVMPCALHTDKSAAAKAAKDAMAMYISEYEIYAKSISEQGFAEDVDRVLANRGRGTMSESVSTELADSFCLNGDVAKIKQQIERMKQIGIELLILEPCFFPEEDFYETVQRTIGLSSLLSHEDRK